MPDLQSLLERLQGATGNSGRTPTDGRPFYCANCGAGYDEWLACDVIECGPLESVQDAVDRLQALIASKSPSEPSA